MTPISEAMLAVALISGTPPVAEATNYWAQIEAFSGVTRSIETSPDALRYLRSLTDEQVVTALRQFGQAVAAKKPPEQWVGLSPGLMILMHFYGDPLRRSDRSDARFQALPETVKQEIQEGMVPGPLSDAQTDRVLAALSDHKEDVFVRYALAQYLAKTAQSRLAIPQKERLVKTYLSVLKNPASPPVLRAECASGAARIIPVEYSLILLSDESVQRLRRSLPAGQSRRWREMVKSGEIQIAENCLQRLAPWREWASDLRNTLTLWSKDGNETKALRDHAARLLMGLADLPLIDQR